MSSPVCRSWPISRDISDPTGRAGEATEPSTVWTPWAWALDHRRPEGVPWKTYLRFMRCALLCAVFGHKEPKLLHHFEPLGKDTQMTLRDACARCGEPLRERTLTAQFPRPRGRGNDWRSN